MPAVFLPPPSVEHAPSSWWQWRQRLRGAEGRWEEFRWRVLELPNQYRPHASCTEADLEKLRVLIRQGLKQEKKQLRALLQDVISRQSVPAAVEMVLQAGADPNVRYDDEGSLDGDTPLTHALTPDSSGHRNYGAVEPLLSFGANPGLANRRGETACSLIIEELIKHPFSPTSGRAEACRRTFELLMISPLALKAGVGPGGRTAPPLWAKAVSLRSLSMLQKLYWHGIDWPVRDEQGRTVWHALLEPRPVSFTPDPSKERREESRIKDDLDCAAFLLKRCRLPANATNAQGETALGQALWNHAGHLAKFLVEHGDVPGPDSRFSPKPGTSLTIPEVIVTRYCLSDPNAAWLMERMGRDCWTWRNDEGKTVVDVIESGLASAYGGNRDRLMSWRPLVEKVLIHQAVDEQSTVEALVESRPKMRL